MTSAKLRSVLGLGVLAGIQDAELTGEEVVGSWKDELRLFSGRATAPMLIEQFLNWSDDPAEILRFTRRYGPLSNALPGGTFRQPLQGWRDHQSFLRKLWREGSSLGYRIGMREGEELAIGRGTVTLIVSSLERFLEFEIFIHPAARRRVCARPDCATPYFIATDLRQRFCSDLCQQWAQQQYKRNWWAEHGRQWRKKRDAKTSVEGKPHTKGERRKPR